MPDEPDNTLELRYVGTRFYGGRIPLDVLPDLSAFRDLIIAVAKGRWFREHPGRLRLPRGFSQSVSFDLIGVKDQSAGPQLQWDRDAAVLNAPDLVDEIGQLIKTSFSDVAELFQGAANDQFPNALPADQIAALNKFGSALLPGEHIEFTGQTGRDGAVIYLDDARRRKLITKVSETYDKRYVDHGSLVTTSTDGYIIVDTKRYGRIQISDISPSIIRSHYDGNLDSEVQFELLVQLDSQDNLRRILKCLDVSIVDASDAQEFRDAMQQIVKLRNLSSGWLDGEGSEISQAAVKIARSVLDQRPDLAGGLGIFPTPEGGINLEFVRNGWDFSIEVLPTGLIEFYGVEVEGDGSLDPVLFDGANEALLVELDSRTGPPEKNAE